MKNTDSNDNLRDILSKTEKFLRKMSRNETLSSENRADAYLHAEDISRFFARQNLDEAIRTTEGLLARTSRPPAEPKCSFCGCVLASDEINRGTCDQCGSRH